MSEVRVLPPEPPGPQVTRSWRPSPVSERCTGGSRSWPPGAVHRAVDLRVHLGPSGLSSQVRVSSVRCRVIGGVLASVDEAAEMSGGSGRHHPSRARVARSLGLDSATVSTDRAARGLCPLPALTLDHAESPKPTIVEVEYRATINPEEVVARRTPRAPPDHRAHLTDPSFSTSGITEGSREWSVGAGVVVASRAVVAGVGVGGPMAGGWRAGVIRPWAGCRRGPGRPVEGFLAGASLPAGLGSAAANRAPGPWVGCRASASGRLCPSGGSCRTRSGPA